ncbi:UPF0340 protein [Caldalkalibacillus thermarum TA2.A1]|uniref:UPF0340 protein CathTA2_2821 n=1 Tax=Caldalkalibacillus thermarum (strain TA2.A1) TaxID=986075 RepID=F5LA86_CALTT|nr:TIGR01440 family protein [Caldalkalibacillus thermarum]EGL81806.1 UPF0340 protein [Caldalkalibacillus thermarum TA2.A1]GGK25843.1 UPF0340 protein [Caldalkalibacillus thermarum]
MKLTSIYAQTRQVLQDLLAQYPLGPKQILVLGVSTSEVLGQKIGTHGSEAVAEAIFNAVEETRQAHGFHVAYQCCEHLNRALVVERNTAELFQLEEVTVIPAPKAGGAMAAYAYRHLADPVMVEHIQAHAGIDIGDTLIGMHLKHVAVPVRGTLKQVGEAHVTMAKTRPKLIGGSRAIYELEKRD